MLRFFVLFALTCFYGNSFASELEVAVLDEPKRVKILVSNVSKEHMVIEDIFVISNCDFIANFCIEAKTMNEEKIDVFSQLQSFDSFFQEREKLRSGKIKGFHLSKRKLASMLKVDKPDFVMITVHYHNKSLDKVFSSNPTKVWVENRESY